MQRLLDYCNTERQTEMIKAYISEGSANGAARLLGVSSPNVARTIRQIKSRAAKVNSLPATTEKVEFTSPEIPNTDTPIDEIIKARCDDFEKQQAKAKAKKWMPFKINTDQPIAITFFGDPHVDNKLCNWPALMKHTSTVAEHPYMYGVNIGDIVDNWVGRLIAEYAEAKVTKSEGWRLADWFVNESGVNWIIHILGNHGTWNDGGEIFTRMAKNVICDDWRAQFKVIF